MKNFLFVLFLFSFIATDAQYKPLVQEGAVFAYSGTFYDGGPSSDTYYYRVSIEGDSIFNDIAYKIINYEIFDEEKTGLIREFDGKVFIILKDPEYDTFLTNCDTALSEILLYDFFVDEGDTLNFCGGPAWVESVGVTDINGLELGTAETVYPVQESSESVVEGIGSINEGIFAPILGWFENEWRFQCVSNGDIQYAPGSSYQINNDCKRIVGIDDTQASSDYVIYPNPAVSVLRIGGVEGSESYIISTSLGEDILIGDLKNGDIDIDGLHSGLYFISINLKGMISVKSFIKL